MNYEEFYGEMQAEGKAVKDGLASLQKLSKGTTREAEKGEMKNLIRDLDGMEEAAKSVLAVIERMKALASGFDTREYFENGEFAEQMLFWCREKDVDVRGDFPVYEMFPYKIRLDVDNQDVYMDRKKVQCVRPKSMVETIKAGQEKLNRASFQAAGFVNELAEAYDLAVLKLGKRPEADIYLTRLYKFLAPMSRFRKDYDKQSFAFDLARLYASDVEETKDGRKFQFGPSREQNKAIRILDKDGKEQFLAMIRFYQEKK